MVHSRRNVTTSAIFRYLVMSLQQEEIATMRQSVVDNLRAGNSIQWLIHQLNPFVGFCQPRSQRSSVGLRHVSRCTGQKFVADGTAYRQIWQATCTQNLGSKYGHRCLGALRLSHIYTTKSQPIDMPLAQCKERPSMFLARRVGSKAKLT